MPSFAMKVYDLQWFTSYGMSYDQAAEALAEDGIDTVLAQNRFDPLPSSGVDQTAYLAAHGERLAAYEDAAWLDALRRHGIAVIETSAVLFDPPALDRFPDARPVNALGQPEAMFDWYAGVCPTAEAYLDWKIGRITRAARELRPDGLFLQFMRYPGFWENWTPDYRFTAADRFCFCDRCRARFATSLKRPPLSPAEILAEHRDAWNHWRGERIVEVVARVGRAAGSLPLMLNTLPFPRSDFNGFDPRREIAAQDLAALSAVIDRFELMTYLQILNRPVEWVAAAVADARAQVPPEKEIVCTLQVAPLYLDGVHAGRNRAPNVTAAEIEAAGRTALDAGADGLVFYHWTDFLHDEAAGGTKRAALRALTHG